MLQLGHFSFVRIAFPYEEKTKYDEANDEKRPNADSYSYDGRRGQDWSSSCGRLDLTRHNGVGICVLVLRHCRIV